MSLWIGEDLNVALTGLVDAVSGSYLNTATVTFALKEDSGTAVAGGTGTCAYVSASDGNYRGILDSAITATLTAGQQYRVEITFDQSNYEGFRRLEYVAQYRGGS